MKKIAILGSTGSIGTQTLEVVRENKDIEVLGLAAGKNIELLEQQIREFHPVCVAVWSEGKAEELKVKIADTDTRVVTGMEGLIEIATLEKAEILEMCIRDRCYLYHYLHYIWQSALDSQSITGYQSICIVLFSRQLCSVFLF